MNTRSLPVIVIACLFAWASIAACAGDDSSPGQVTDTATAPADDTASAPDTEVGADTPTPPDVVAPGPPGGRNPVGDAVALGLEPFSVASGTERQVCKTINLPGDEPLDVVRIRAAMAGKSHHFNLYKVIDDKKFEPVTVAEATVRDCAPADEQLSGDAAYLFGSATAERVFDTPEGVAFHLEPGQRLILEQHVINFTPEPMEGGVTLELFEAGADADIRHHADIIWFANWGFLLPPGQETSSTKRCDVPYDVEVFGLMSHFHELGTHFTIETVTEEGAELVYEDSDWAHPKYAEYWPPLTLRAGEGLRWTCTWVNTRGHVVGPNKNSTDEMCITFAAAYPKNSLSGDPIQCNVLF